MALQPCASFRSVPVTRPCFVWSSDALMFATIPYNREQRVQDKIINSHSILLQYSLCCESIQRDAVLDVSFWTVSGYVFVTHMQCVNACQMQASAGPSCSTAQEECARLFCLGLKHLSFFDIENSFFCHSFVGMAHVLTQALSVHIQADPTFVLFSL